MRHGCRIARTLVGDQVNSWPYCTLLSLRSRSVLRRRGLRGGRGGPRARSGSPAPGSAPSACARSAHAARTSHPLRPVPTPAAARSAECLSARAADKRSATKRRDWSLACSRAHRQSRLALVRLPARDLMRHGCRIRPSMDGFTACPAAVGGQEPCSQGADHALCTGSIHCVQPSQAPKLFES